MPFKCNYSGTQAIDLRWHMTMHSGEKRHMFLHSGGKHFKCMQCNYSDTIADNLKKHILVHSGEKPLMCKQCNNVYTWSIHLKRRSRHCIIIFLPIGWMLPVLSLDKVNMARSNHIFSASVDWTNTELAFSQIYLSCTAFTACDTMWDPVMKAFPKVDESESGQMVLK